MSSTGAIAARLRDDRAAGRSRSLSSAIVEATVASRRGVVYATLIALLPLLPYLFAEGVDAGRGRAARALVRPGRARVDHRRADGHARPGVPALLARRRRPGVAARPPDLPPRTGLCSSACSCVPPPSVGTSAAVLVLASRGGVGPSFDQSLLPSFRDPDLVVRWNAAAGTSEPEMARLTTPRHERPAQRYPGVANVGAHVGRAVLGDQVVDVNSAELWVTHRSRRPTTARPCRR